MKRKLKNREGEKKMGGHTIAMILVIVIGFIIGYSIKDIFLDILLGGSLF